ncbi:TetR/AcrR family transcriptional regulator [Desulfatibacillum aliphaticivorans]|uniref:TetR/AcrR family transcriptional regulator n=1 Tax=Desulfatibacillum aliphaticivorans TaxID=218208 RepID=UPI0004092EA7|nr:TetR/AcrR family transcriptional regulator [Desulfatibacillum aliphaticivorans]
MATPRLKTQERKKQIVQAALTLVSTRGVAAMTMERTSRLVGISPSALYRHFKNKAEMLDAVLDLLDIQFANEIQEALDNGRDALDSLRYFLMQRVRFIMEHRSIPRLLYSEEILYKYPELQKKVNDIFKNHILRLQDVVRQGQDQGLIRTDVTPVETAVMFIGLFKPVDEIYDIIGGRFDLVAHIHKVWNIFVEAISP